VHFADLVQLPLTKLNDEVTEFGWFDPHNLPDDLILFHGERILAAL
jgi:hypothetical protein